MLWNTFDKRIISTLDICTIDIKGTCQWTPNWPEPSSRLLQRATLSVPRIDYTSASRRSARAGGILFDVAPLPHASFLLVTVLTVMGVLLSLGLPKGLSIRKRGEPAGDEEL